MSAQVWRYILAGMISVGVYVGGVWLGTDVLGLPVRLVNIGFYILSSLVAYGFNAKWVFESRAPARETLAPFMLMRGFGVILNIGWVEAGLRWTSLYPWVLAASFFAVWPLIAFIIQKRVIFKR